MFPSEAPSLDQEPMPSEMVIVAAFAATAVLTIGGIYCYVNHCAGSKESDILEMGQNDVDQVEDDEEDAPEGEQIAAETPQARKEHNRSHFLSDEQKWKLAKEIFPGILKQSADYTMLKSNPRETVEQFIWERIMRRYGELNRKDVEHMLENNHDEDLCIALGIDETVTRKRFEVVRNLRNELGLQNLVPILNQIRRLVFTFGVKNSYGEEGDIYDSYYDDNEDIYNSYGGEDNIYTAYNPKTEDCWPIKEHYNGKKWQSYTGIQLKKECPKAAASIMIHTLKSNNSYNCFAHGACGKTLHGINTNEELLVSMPGQHIRHDLGAGFYTFGRGQFMYAFAWAISTCWPIYSQKEERFLSSPENAEENFRPGEHNPAVIMFPEPNFNDKLIFDVHEKPIANKQDLLNRYGEEVCEKIRRTTAAYGRSGGNESDNNWKTAVKLFRYFKYQTSQTILRGRLHDPQQYRIIQTDSCAEPKMDSDKNYIQYCFQYPDIRLGNKRLFVEFKVDWNEWLTDEMKVTTKAHQRVSRDLT